MKKFKAVLITIISVFILTCVLSFSAAAAESKITTQFHYQTGTLLIYGTGELKNLCDAPYSDHANTSDCLHKADELCSGCYSYSVQSIIISDGITSIDHCFFDCTALKTVYLPKTLKTIKGGSFISCTNLQSITIPESVTVIDNAFNECTSLEWVNIPKKITTLRGFGGSKLTSLEIPRTVKALALSCDSLEKIYLPETVTAEMLKPTGYVNSYTNRPDGKATFSGLHTKSKKLVVTGYDKSAAKDWAKKYKHNFNMISPIPEKLTVSNKNKDIKISWSKVDKTEKWTLYRKAKGEDSWTTIAKLDGKVTSYSDKTVKNGKTYTYRLKGDSNKIYLEAKIGRIDRPTGVSIYAASATTATLKWKKVTGAKYYYVYQVVLDGGSKTTYKKLAKVDAKSTSYKLTKLSLESGSTVKYCVRSHDGTSYSAYSDIVEFSSGKILFTSCKPDYKKNTLTFKWYTSKNITEIQFRLFYFGSSSSKELKSETITVKASKFKTSDNQTYVTITPKADLDKAAYLKLEVTANVKYKEKASDTKAPLTVPSSIKIDI